MQILRVLVLSSLAVASALAQSSPDKNTIPAKPETFTFVPSPDLRLPPTLPQYVFRGEQSNLLQRNSLPRLTLNPAQDNKPQTYLGLPPNLSQNRLLLPPKNQRCYAMRSYRFNRDNPTSDSTDFAEYSTCQSADDFQLKAALDIHTR
jgi:hypothetical protein